jgi:hypothetical protein
VFYESYELMLKKQLNIEYAIRHRTEMRLTVFEHRDTNGNIWTRREEDTGGSRIVHKERTIICTLSQGCPNPGSHAAMTSIICGFSVWNLLLVTILAPEILRWLL